MNKNPIETIEDFMFDQEWALQRLSPYEVMAEIRGRWCDYHLHFVWDEEDLALQFFIVLMDIEIPPEKLSEVYALECLINEKLKLGHFEIFKSIGVPTFRHSLLLTGTRTINEMLLHRLTELALESCERFYRSFQFVIFGHKSPEEATMLSGLESVGEA